MKRNSISCKRLNILITAVLVILLMASILIPAGTSRSVNARTASGVSARPADIGYAETVSLQGMTASRTPDTGGEMNIIAVRDPVNSSAEQQIMASVDSKNSLIVNIQGSVEAPGQVIVEYWSAGTGPYITGPVSTRGTAFSLQVMRLRPETRYDYKVFLVGVQGAPVLQSQGTFTTGTLPKELQNARFELRSGNPTYDLIFLDFNDTDFAGIVAIDRAAQVVWYYKNDKSVFALAQRNHSLVLNEIFDPIGWSLKEIAPDGSLIRSYDDSLGNGMMCQPHGRFHHEMLLRPDNKVWTLGSEIRPVTINGKDRLQTGDTIEEWDIAAGTVTRLVSFFDILDPTRDRTETSNTTEGFFWKGCQDQYPDAEDWTHSNSLSLATDGKILVSHRHLDQVSAIEPDFSRIAWRLGGLNSDFTFPNPADRFWHQHSAQMLPNGHILLFDNGNLRPEEDGGEYSRALELELDWKTMEARKVWEYRHKPDLYASAVCSVYRLENGNTVIIFGRDDVNKPGIFTLVEAGPDGKAVAVTEISSEGKTIQYRAVPADSINGEIPGSVAQRR